MLYMAASHSCNQCYNVLPASFMFGIAYSLYVPTLWASPSVVAERSAIGLAYGLISAIRNLGVSLVMILTGVIRDISRTYNSVTCLAVNAANRRCCFSWGWRYWASSRRLS